jgi:hypothetical protein
MPRSDFLHRFPFWRQMIWLVIISTLILLVTIMWMFQKKVDRIDREFEKIHSYETK